MSSVLAFIRLGRPHFLAGGFLLYGLGAVIAAVFGHAMDPHLYLLGQGTVTAFQLMTHYANDYYDYDADVANTTPTRWSGGSRVLSGGELPRKVALIGALGFAGIGILLSALLVRTAGIGVLGIVISMAVLAWTYSAPPLRLCARGLGELATMIVVTGLVPWLAFVLQAPDLIGAKTLLLAITPLALLQLGMLFAIEFPDAAGDEATGKRTLVVRLGATRAAQIYVLILTAAYLALPLGSLLGLPTRVVIAATLPAPLAIWRIAAISDRADPQAHARLAFFGVFLLVGTTIAELVAFGSLL